MKKILLLLLIISTPLVAQNNLPPEFAEQEGGSRFYEEFLNMMFMLGLLVALLYLGTWVFKRMATSRVVSVNQTSNIKIIESRAISTKTVIYNIEVEGKKFTLAESLNGITPIGEGKKVT